MVIRIGKKSDFPRLVQIYKLFFKKHNIFQQDGRKVINYLQQQIKENELLVFEDEKDGKLKGALFIVKIGQSSDGKHTLWKYRHFAFKNDSVGSLLLREAEKYVRKQSKTAKVELTIAENERGIDFYKNNGYKQEAALSHHYRFGETCFILSKAFSIITK